MRILLRCLLALQCAALALANISAQAPSSPAAPPPARTVKGQVLTSAATPAVRLEFAKEFKYVGAQDFILYDVARAEQHFFVDADSEGRIKRLYWVQFEGYLPSNTHTYRYQPTKTVEIGGLQFIAATDEEHLKISPLDEDAANPSGLAGKRQRPVVHAKFTRTRQHDGACRRRSVAGHAQYWIWLDFYRAGQMLAMQFVRIASRAGAFRVQ